MIPTIPEEKKRIRKEAIGRRRRLSDEQRTRADRFLTETLLALIERKKPEKVLLYASTKEEAGTDGIARALSERGIGLYYPKVCGSEMIFYRVRELSELREGYRGIREPIGYSEAYRGIREPSGYSEAYREGSAASAASSVCRDSEEVPARHQEIVIVPGCAFTERGQRIGYGGGYYDRFLSTNGGLYRVGICYDVQLYDELPAEAHDVILDEIISVPAGAEKNVSG